MLPSVRLDRPAETLSSVPLIDIATSPDGRDVAQLLEGGEVQLGLDYTERGTLTPFIQNRRAIAVRIAERRLFALETDGVSSWSLQSQQVGPGESARSGGNQPRCCMPVPGYRH